MKFLRRFYGRLPRRNPDGRFESPVDSVRRDMVQAESINLTLDLAEKEQLDRAIAVAEVAYVGE